ncbi:MAG: hypothetical protein QXK24_02145 [Ignisphaera sp.]
MSELRLDIYTFTCKFCGEKFSGLKATAYLRYNAHMIKQHPDIAIQYAKQHNAEEVEDYLHNLVRYGELTEEEYREFKKKLESM